MCSIPSPFPAGSSSSLSGECAGPSSYRQRQRSRPGGHGQYWQPENLLAVAGGKGTSLPGYPLERFSFADDHCINWRAGAAKQGGGFATCGAEGTRKQEAPISRLDITRNSPLNDDAPSSPNSPLHFPIFPIFLLSSFELFFVVLFRLLFFFMHLRKSKT